MFYLFLKKVFATQQKLVENMFNMLSKYNAGIWVKKQTSNVKCCSFRSVKICLEKGFSLCLTPRIQNLSLVFFLVFCSDIHYLLLHQQTIVACACNNEGFSCGVCMFLHCLRISLGTPG